MSPLGKFLLENCDNDLSIESIDDIRKKAFKAGTSFEIQDVKWMCVQLGITIKNSSIIKSNTLLGWLGSVIIKDSD